MVHFEITWESLGHILGGFIVEKVCCSSGVVLWMNISDDMLLANEGENAILTLVPPQSDWNLLSQLRS